jgi:hypothetical protein
VNASSTSALEAERQVVEASNRYREVVASMEAGGRPEAGQRAALKAVGRSLQLVAFVLQRAAAAGIAVERLAELTAWDAELVRQALERRPEPALVARLAPPGIDSAAVARAAASFEAEQRLRGLVDQMLAEVADAAWSPAAADLDDLREQLHSVWQHWRQSLGRGAVAVTAPDRRDARAGSS